MNIQFATCNRKNALDYIQKVYPNVEVKDEGSVSELLDLVEKDIIRIQDPMMYGNRIGIIPSANWEEKHREKVIELGNNILKIKEVE